MNKKLESLRNTKEFQNTKPKQFYNVNNLTYSQNKQSLIRTGKKGFKPMKDQVGQLFNDYAALERANGIKMEREHRQRKALEERIKFEERDERKRMADYMKGKKDQGQGKKTKRSTGEYLKDWKWQKMCGHCDKPKRDKSKNRQTQTKKRFASRSRSMNKRQRSKSVEGVRRKEYVPKAKRNSVKSINSKRSRVSNYARDNIQLNKKRESSVRRESNVKRDQSIRRKSSVKRDQSIRRKSSVKRDQSIRRKSSVKREPSKRRNLSQRSVYSRNKSRGKVRKKSTKKGKRTNIGKDLGYGRDWKIDQSNKDCNNFCDKLKEIAKYDNKRAAALMNNMINQKIADAKRKKEKKRKRDEMIWMGHNVEKLKSRKQIDDETAQEKLALWKEGVERQLDTKRQRENEKQMRKRAISQELKREEKRLKNEQRERFEREEIKRQKYLEELADQVYRDRKRKRNKRALSVKLEQEMGNVFIDERPRIHHQEMMKRRFKEQIETQREEGRLRKQLQNREREREKEEDRRNIKMEQEKERRFQEKIKRKEKKLLIRQMETQRMDNEKKRQIQDRINREEMYEIRKKEGLERRIERDNIIKQQRNKDEYLKNLGEQVMEKKKRKEKERHLEKEIRYKGFHTTGDTNRYFDYELCKKWCREMKDYSDKSIY